MTMHLMVVAGFANGVRLWRDAAICLIRQSFPPLGNRPEVEETTGRPRISGLHA
jgi:hypothetical protein